LPSDYFNWKRQQKIKRQKF